MFYLTNTASAIFRQLSREADGQEIGSRFQHIAGAALRWFPDYREDFYENEGAGQPDCYSNKAESGFEMKYRTSSQPIQLDRNSWEALSRYKKSYLIALLAVSFPCPLWVVPLPNPASTAIKLSRMTAVDERLEAYLKECMSALIEDLGAQFLITSPRAEFKRVLRQCAEERLEIKSS
jgi:hypothetical protein